MINNLEQIIEDTISQLKETTRLLEEKKQSIANETKTNSPMDRRHNIKNDIPTSPCRCNSKCNKRTVCYNKKIVTEAEDK